MIGVSIVLYKTSPRELYNCVESFANCDLVSKIYLIDNFKDQAGVYQYRDHRVEYFFSGANFGYGKAHNMGIRKSLKDGLKFHIVLNSDTNLGELDIGRLIDVYEKNDDFGILIPQVRDDDGNVSVVAKLLPSPAIMIARMMKIDRYFNKAYNRFNLTAFSENEFIFAPYISGCFMFFSTKKISEIGFFDERFFMYPEDIDLSRRFWGKYKNVLFSSEYITHSHRGESKKSPKMFYVHINNMARFFWKWGWLIDRERGKINEIAISLNAGGRQ